MAQNDSLDKVIPTYFGAFNTAPFEYGGKVYEPRPLRVSPLLARGLGCPPGCAGCCPRFSLDWLPFEDMPRDDIPKRTVMVNKKLYIVHSDMQKPGWHCKNVIHTEGTAMNGRCGIHGKQPFSCDFEIIRLKHFNALGGDPNQILTAPFGRAWAMLRVDGERGALCEVTEETRLNAFEAARKLRRLAGWMEYFEVPHKVGAVVEYLENGGWILNAPLIV